MPLCCPEHILAGWRYVNSLMVRRALDIGWLTPEQVEAAKDRIILRAIEHGLIDPADGRSWRLP